MSMWNWFGWILLGGLAAIIEIIILGFFIEELEEAAKFALVINIFIFLIVLAIYLVKI